MTRIPHPEMTHELSKLIYAKATWLSTFSQGSKARPPHEIDRVKRERAVLEQAHDDYAAAAARDERKQA